MEVVSLAHGRIGFIEGPLQILRWSPRSGHWRDCGDLTGKFEILQEAQDHAAQIIADLNAYLRQALQHRLLNRREIDPDTNCWVYTGGWNSNDHGIITALMTNGKRLTLLVHAAAAYAWLNIAPRQKIIYHDCQTPACFNPDHLLTTHSLAALRKIIYRRDKSKYATNTKMTAWHAALIKDAIREGTESLAEISRRLDLSYWQVYHIARDNYWKNVKSEIPDKEARQPKKLRKENKP